LYAGLGAASRALGQVPLQPAAGEFAADALEAIFSNAACGLEGMPSGIRPQQGNPHLLVIF